jgi:epsilon-lactone hydrolase
MSIQLFLLDKLFRVVMKRRFARRPDVIELRPLMNLFVRRTRRLPREISLEFIRLGGIETELLQPVLRPAGADQTRAILYIHGGAFVAGSAKNIRPIAWRLAQGSGAPVYAIDYRLAPEHPFPAALEDSVAAYRALLESGKAPERISLGGESAGGNLVLALALRLKQLGLPQPGALFCLSPATDFLHPFDSRKSNAKSDAMFDSRMFKSAIPHYCREQDPANPLMSPLRGDLAGLPRTLLLCGEGEMLRDDSVLMAERMKAAGVPVQLERWPDVFHAWPVVADYLPEARRAIELILRFLKAGETAAAPSR